MMLKKPDFTLVLVVVVALAIVAVLTLQLWLPHPWAHRNGLLVTMVETPGVVIYESRGCQFVPPESPGTCVAAFRT
jgi:hypothetical protein